LTGPVAGRAGVRVLVRGCAEGRALVLDAPLSFWGGLDPVTGRIIDRRHPQCGECVTGRVLIMSSGRGSSSSSTVLAEAIRLGTGPAAIVLEEDDAIVVLGAVVAEELYSRTVPVVAISSIDPAIFSGAPMVVIDGDALRIGGNAHCNSEGENDAAGQN
jgi:predicted aconitase with swiveling domain